MIPRGAPDIGWQDLWTALTFCALPHDATAAQARVESRWSDQPDVLACLSVRSGFDLLLQALALPAGSEVLVSAVTIPDMLTILKNHGLVPVAVDLDLQNLGVSAAALQQQISPASKAILVAHLFGSRMPLEPIIEVARQHGLLVLEDCAQAYDASAYRGHPASDVSLFSFGPIKTATALGGALLRVRDTALLAQLRRQQAAYPRQSRSLFARRVGRFIALKALARPWLFALFVAVCRWRGREHDQMIYSAVRGFGSGDLLRQLRQQPSVPLLRLLERRLRRADPQRIARRAARLSRIVSQEPALKHPGAAAVHHRHWMLPIFSREPDTLVRLLWAHGFDATRKASSLVVVPPAPHQPQTMQLNAQQMLDRLVYLPVAPALPQREHVRLRRIIIDFEHAPARAPQLSPPLAQAGAWRQQMAAPAGNKRGYAASLVGGVARFKRHVPADKP